MLLYEHERTSDIISRLVRIAKMIRISVLATYVIGFGAVSSLIGVFLLRDFWWVGGLVGIGVGYALGAYIASLLTVTIEWMAQLLVAQGEILASLKK